MPNLRVSLTLSEGDLASLKRVAQKFEDVTVGEVVEKIVTFHFNKDRTSLFNEGMVALAEKVLSAVGEYMGDSVDARAEKIRASGPKTTTRLGRPPSMSLEQVDRASSLRRGGWPYKTIAEELGVHESSVRRALRR